MSQPFSSRGYGTTYTPYGAAGPAGAAGGTGGGGGTGAFGPPPTPPPAPGNPTPQPAELRRRRSIAGAAALILGVIALLVGWVPVLGLTMLIPAVLAVLLGVFGFSKALVTGRTGKILPFTGAFVGVLGCLIPPASTLIAAMTLAPWAWMVGMDQVQVELEHQLTRQGVESERAEQIGGEIGDVLRSFADAGNWRDGIAAMHRFSLINDAYRRDLMALDASDTTGHARLAERFSADLSHLARRQGVDLNAADLQLLIDALRKEQEEGVANWREWQRRNSMHSGMYQGYGYHHLPYPECH